MGNAHLTRRALLGEATAVALGAATAAAQVTAAAQAATEAAEVPPLWREFTRTPFTHPRIPYVGRAGYGGGAPRFPRRPVVADVRDFGAVPDGTTDSAPAINRAIAAAGRAGGGTVTIPPGTFRIDDVIRVGHSNVVLRGAGSSRTTLHATKNLTELIGAYGSRYGGDKSSWSWAGGLWTQASPGPHGPLEHPRHRDQGEGLALRGLDGQPPRRVAPAHAGRPGTAGRLDGDGPKPLVPAPRRPGPPSPL